MKRAVFIIVLIASLLVIRNLVVSIYSLWQKQDLLVKSADELKREKERNKDLKIRIDQSQSAHFIEEQARNKLFLVKEGEQDILISRKLLQPQNVSSPHAQSVPNWQLWMQLFN